VRSAFHRAAEIASFLLAGLLLAGANGLQTGDREHPGIAEIPVFINEPPGPEFLNGAHAADPANWMIAFEAGFQYYSLHDYRSAATCFAWANQLPGHPDYIERFAALALRN
jgi:hypothetical protein